MGVDPGARGPGPPSGTDDGSRFVQPHYTNVIMPFDADPPGGPGGQPRRRAPPDGHRAPGVGVAGGSCCASARPSRSSVRSSTVPCVGVGTDSRLPNEFDITSHVRPGRRALVVLVVVRWSAATWVEDQDQWWHGGIQRSVTLHSTAPSYLADVKALPGLRAGEPAAGAPTGTLDLELTVDGPATRERGWTVETSVETLRRDGGAGRTTGHHRRDWTCPCGTAPARARRCCRACSSSPAWCAPDWRSPASRRGRTRRRVRYRVMVTLRDAGRRQWSRSSPCAPGSVRWRCRTTSCGSTARRCCCTG